MSEEALPDTETLLDQTLEQLASVTKALEEERHWRENYESWWNKARTELTELRNVTKIVEDLYCDKCNKFHTIKCRTKEEMTAHRRKRRSSKK